MRPVLALSLVVVWAGAARAQPVDPQAPGEPVPPPSEPPPSDPPPSDPPPPPPVPPPPTPGPAIVTTTTPVEPAAPVGYPLQLAMRPLVLPVGGFEAGAELQWTRTGASPNSTSYVAAEPRLRYSAPGVELEARVGIGLYQTEQSLAPGLTIEVERLASVAGMVRARLSDDTALGAEVIARAPSAEYPSYFGRVFAVTKRHLSPRSAVELEGFFGGNRAIASVNAMGMPEYDVTPTGGGEVRAIAQISDAIGVIGRGGLSVQRFELAQDSKHYLVATFGVRAVAAVSPDVDLVAGIDVLQLQNAMVAMTVGFVVRRIP